MTHDHDMTNSQDWRDLGSRSKVQAQARSKVQAQAHLHQVFRDTSPDDAAPSENDSVLHSDGT